MNAPLTKPEYVEMPEIALRRCKGCVNHNVSNDTALTACTAFRDQNNLRDCISHGMVFVRNTPKGRAAYVAAKLEHANG